MKTHSLSARKFYKTFKRLAKQNKISQKSKIKNYQLLNKYKDLKNFYFYIFTTTK